MEKIVKKSEEYLQKYIDLRREIHKNPEIAFQEFKTNILIKKEFESLKINVVSPIAKTGLIAIIEGVQKGKTVLLRADMDALDIEEISDSRYCSQNKGMMHACGHDVHIAILLETAAILNEFKNEFRGTIKFLFQPAEEGIGGALPMIQEGVLDNPKVDYCAALHVDPSIATGKIKLSYGPIMASPDNFKLVILGRGGHGAMPQNNIDPILISAKIIEAFQSIISRMTDPLKPAVISVCSIKSGTNYNVTPDCAELLGTLRTFDNKLREDMPKQIEQIVKGICQSYGAEYKLDFNFLYPPLINDNEVVDRIKFSAGSILGEENVILENDASMLGDDFSYFSQRVPSVYFKLGCKKEGLETSLHRNDFDVDENCIMTGSQVLSKFILDILKK